MLLTRANISQLRVPPGKAEITYWDDEIKGFGLRLRQGGAGRWIVQFRNAQGQQRKLTLSQIPMNSVDQARAAAERVIRNIADDRDPQAEKVALRKAREVEKFKLSDLLKLYLPAAKDRLRASSYDEVERHLQIIWAPIHSIAVGALDSRRIALELDKIAKARGLITANRARSSLSAMMGWGIEKGRVDSNPVINVAKALKREPKRERVLTDEELADVWACCGQDDFGRIVRLLILTAARREEVAGARWPEIDLSRGTWQLPAERVKNGRSHLIPLPQTAVSILRSVDRREKRELLFGEGEGSFAGWSKSKARLDETIASRRQKIATETGIEPLSMPPWRIHDLRRSAATGMARLGISIAVIERALNHVSGEFKGIVAVYQRHDFQREVQEAFAAWAEHIGAITREKNSDAASR
ncbi:site-specific integrase [uncultured Bosea sp.]|uniref:tyrosine-type recombinase/integrase n=1 Tax=uncultured Bosea sp. TaxID=211457 RepID=UPI00263B76EA|nr:site-specific integrase [uncultured Bosea sp.]